MQQEAPRDLLPPLFRDWFAGRGWRPRAHQLDVLAEARAGRSVLLVAPTGGGKTLAGFLPTLTRLAERPAEGLDTLYVSPLKALAVDIARNLDAPVAGTGLKVRIETRTGDTPQGKRARQKYDPPHILITTPEQVSLLIADAQAERLFSTLKTVVVDEAHALAPNKRGTLLSLALSRVQALAPEHHRIGLSATVADPETLAAWLSPQPGAARLVMGVQGASPDISVLDVEDRIPWSGHSARHTVDAIYARIREARLALVFVNTRSQAELLFQELWRVNEDGLPIALHHGSLDVAQRRKVEGAMAAGRLKAVVCTSTLDLGIDWGDVDLVVNVGSPKGSSRILQRIGRANHRLDEPSKALLVPANRFEVLECEAARAAAQDGAQDTEPPAELKRDVLAQHILGVACACPFLPDALYGEVRTAWPYRALTREDFDQAVNFVATGGYALKSYERYAKLRPLADGRLRIAHPRIAQRYRLNAGTIVQAEMLKVRLVSPRRAGGGRLIGRGGRMLGEV
jgi:ATP-dependent Lhr-like helicase